MNIQVILTVTVLLTLALAVGAPTIASAQYFNNITNPKTLEEVMKLQEYTVSVSPPNDQPDPHFTFIGIMIGTFISLGIIAAVFFIKGRSGKYAAVGR